MARISLSFFMNHARHEIGHAVGAKAFKDVGEIGDGFAKLYGGWGPSSKAGIIAAYWTKKGTTVCDWTSCGGSATQSINDIDVADWLAGYIETGDQPPGNAITALKGSKEAKLAALSSKYGSEQLFKYFTAIGGLTPNKDNAYMFPGFVPSSDEVHIWCSRGTPAVGPSIRRARTRRWCPSHGWYSFASYKEMFAEMYTRKYSGGGVPAAANGKDPGAFFKSLDESKDSDTLTNLGGRLPRQAQPVAVARPPEVGAAPVDAAATAACQQPTGAGVAACRRRAPRRASCPDCGTEQEVLVVESANVQRFPDFESRRLRKDADALRLHELCASVRHRARDAVHRSRAATVLRGVSARRRGAVHAAQTRLSIEATYRQAFLEEGPERRSARRSTTASGESSLDMSSCARRSSASTLASIDPILEAVKVALGDADPASESRPSLQSVEGGRLLLATEAGAGSSPSSARSTTASRRMQERSRRCSRHSGRGCSFRPSDATSDECQIASW